MSLIDKLLQMDKGKLMSMPTKGVEMPRLSEILGEDFKVKCKAIDGERYADIQRSAIDLNKRGGLLFLGVQCLSYCGCGTASRC